MTENGRKPLCPNALRLVLISSNLDDTLRADQSV